MDIDYWLNEKNWLNIPLSQEGIHYKKHSFLSLTMFHQNLSTHFENEEQKKTFNLLCKDVDLCTYLLSRYVFQHEQMETIPSIKKHLSYINYVKRFVAHGIHYKFREFIFSHYPEIINDKELALLAMKNSTSYKEYFSPLFSDYSFVKKCLQKNIICDDFLLFYPNNKVITKKLLSHYHYPNDNNSSLYNIEVMSDKSFILPILLSNNGYSLYKYLPSSLKLDVELCDAVKAKHPHQQVEVSSINNLEQFINTLNNKSAFSTEMYTVLENIKNFDFIMNDSMAIAQILVSMAEHGCSSYIELMGDPSFTSHPMQQFLEEVSLIHSDIKNFLDTNVGKNIISHKISNYSEYTDFENNIFPMIGKTLFIHLNAEKLNNNLPVKNQSHKKNKI